MPVITERKELVFNDENWFELYYRLGFTWDKIDRATGAPNSIAVLVPGHKYQDYPQGTVFVFDGMDLVEAYKPGSVVPSRNMVKVNGVVYLVEPVAYEDIKEGDPIIHIADQDSNPQLWMGKVTEVGLTGAWGEARYHALYDNEEYTVDGTNLTTDPVLIAYPWHETEPGHALYKVTGRSR